MSWKRLQRKKAGRMKMGYFRKDYCIDQEIPYEEQLQQAAKLLDNAQMLLIGAGAGASAAAGLTYDGERFYKNFQEFIEKYGKIHMRDMYSSGFYPFPTQEAKWGYWSKHSMINRFLPPALPLYQKLYEAVKEKDYFVLTTNVDHQFQKAGFAVERIFATQGDYGMIQCEKGCHPKIYDAEELFRRMDRVRKECLIPSDMVPKCPVCGGNMMMHLRCDGNFVEDEDWHAASERYVNFVQKTAGKSTVLLELGVGFNTPGIIKYPFWRMTAENPKAVYVCINYGAAGCPEEIAAQSICIDGDIGEVLEQLW